MSAFSGYPSGWRVRATANLGGIFGRKVSVGEEGALLGVRQDTGQAVVEWDNGQTCQVDDDQVVSIEH